MHDINKTVNDKEGKAMKEFTFTSKRGEVSQNLSKPVEGCKASKVLMEVLQVGEKPSGLKLQHAPSYNAYFISRKGKNALGFFSTNNLLVVNGIAAELAAKGYEEDIIQPQKSKKYRAIRLADKEDSYIQKLVRDVAAILGFAPSSGEAKKAKKKAKKGKMVAVPEVTA